MKENKTDGKLDTKPVPKRVAETSTVRPRSKIKFTDYSIELPLDY